MKKTSISKNNCIFPKFNLQTEIRSIDITKIPIDFKFSETDVIVKVNNDTFIITTDKRLDEFIIN